MANLLNFNNTVTSTPTKLSPAWWHLVKRQNRQLMFLKMNSDYKQTWIVKRKTLIEKFKK